MLENDFPHVEQMYDFKPAWVVSCPLGWLEDLTSFVNAELVQASRVVGAAPAYEMLLSTCRPLSSVDVSTLQAWCFLISFKNPPSHTTQCLVSLISSLTMVPPVSFLTMVSPVSSLTLVSPVSS